MNDAPRGGPRREVWLTAAVALIMLPSLALAAAPPGASRIIGLGLVLAGMLLAVIVG
jgi:hypothetical protein